MTWERPAALALLLVLPLLWRLHRRRAPRVVRVASVDPYRGEAGTPDPWSARRGADPVLALLLASAAALAVAAAGPGWSPSLPRVRIVLDRSASMAAALAPPATGTAGESARGVAETLLAAALGPHEATTVEIGSDDEIAAAAEAARADGLPGAILVTDHVPADLPAGVVVVGPDAPRRANAAIVRAWMDAAAAHVAARNFGTVPLDAAVLGVTRTLPPGAEISFEVPLPARGRSGAVALDVDDALDADDGVTLRRTGGARRVRVSGASEPVLAALRALGVEVTTAGDADAALFVESRIGPAGSLPEVHLAPRESAPGGPVAVREVPGPVRAATLSLHADAEFPLPAASSRLVAHARLDGGTPLLSDAEGALAVAAGRLVAIALDPDDPSSDWRRDGSFVAAIGAALDLATDGPERLVVESAVPAAESDIAPAPLQRPSDFAVRAAAGPGARADVSGAAALLGALLAAGAAFAGARRARARA